MKKKCLLIFKWPIYAQNAQKVENIKVVPMNLPGVEHVRTSCESMFELPRGSQLPYTAKSEKLTD